MEDVLGRGVMYQSSAEERFEALNKAMQHVAPSEFLDQLSWCTHDTSQEIHLTHNIYFNTGCLPLHMGLYIYPEGTWKVKLLFDFFDYKCLVGQYAMMTCDIRSTEEVDAEKLKPVYDRMISLLDDQWVLPLCSADVTLLHFVSNVIFPMLYTACKELDYSTVMLDAIDSACQIRLGDLMRQRVQSSCAAMGACQ